MKTIGLIGGISWVSTADYYRYINEQINSRSGGTEYAHCLIHSFNYADIQRNNAANDWAKTTQMLALAGKNLISSGAELIVVCANTMHHIADQLQAAFTVPLIHVATETAKEISKKKMKKVGLLGTRFTMELPFFREKLALHEIESLIPEEADRVFLHRTIAEELGKGLLLPETHKRYVEISEKLIARGAEGIILGCTEIPLLIKAGDVSKPVFDTTFIHASAAVEAALA
jgi:aspartate racemase